VEEVEVHITMLLIQEQVVVEQVVLEQQLVFQFLLILLIQLQ
jgi:hypothetical protein